MILCCGESLIDMLPTHIQQAPGIAFRPKAGGAVYNTAIALARLGAPTSYLWPISRDDFGEAVLLPMLEEAKVDFSLSPRPDRPTTLAFVELNGRQATYRFYDENTAGRLFSEDELPELPKDLDALFIGGISLVNDPCGQTVETLVARARANGIPIMIDPNIRPFFVSDEESYRARLERLFTQVDFVKMSHDEYLWLTKRAISPTQLISQILAKGAKAVFYTEGHEGASVHWADGVLPLSAPKMQVADTIGAGDTFNAAVMTSLLSSKALHAPTPDDLHKALESGILAAAVTVSRDGANPPWSHEVEAIRAAKAAQIKVRQIGPFDALST